MQIGKGHEISYSSGRPAASIRLDKQRKSACYRCCRVWSVDSIQIVPALPDSAQPDWDLIVIYLCSWKSYVHRVEGKSFSCLFCRFTRWCLNETEGNVVDRRVNFPFLQKLLSCETFFDHWRIVERKRGGFLYAENDEYSQLDLLKLNIWYALSLEYDIRGEKKTSFRATPALMLPFWFSSKLGGSYPRRWVYFL